MENNDGNNNMAARKRAGAKLTTTTHTGTSSLVFVPVNSTVAGSAAAPGAGDTAANAKRFKPIN